MEAMADEVSTAKWRLRVISRSMYCAKNEPASCKVHLGDKLGDFASAVMSGASCQDLQATCEVSGGSETVCFHVSVSCLAATVTVQGCHLPSDSLHVQFIGMALYTVGTCRASDVSVGLEVVGSSESDTEVVPDQCSVYDSPQFSAASPMFDTPEFATASPESCPLVDTPVFSTSSPGSCPWYNVSVVPTTPPQEVYTSVGTSRGHRLDVLGSSSSDASFSESRSPSPATTISYEDDFPSVVLPLCGNAQWQEGVLASDVLRSAR